MKNDRLFEMMYLLLQKQAMTAPELSQKLEVSVRTVYRDVETLAKAGVPVYTTSGRNGGIFMSAGFTVDKALLSGEEQKRLVFALQSLRATGQDVDKLMEKLGAVFQTTSENWIEVDFSRWGCHQTDSDRFETIKTAILDRHVLQMRYCGSDGQTKVRRVEPIKLIFRDKSWYLQAFCQLAQAFRTFKLSRMSEMETLDERFARTGAELPPLDPPQPAVELTSLLLRFSSDAAFRVYDEFEMSQIQREEDGTLLVRTEMPAGEWLIGYLFTFGTSLRVLEPEWMIEKLCLCAKQIGEIYKN